MIKVLASLWRWSTTSQPKLPMTNSAPVAFSYYTIEVILHSLFQDLFIEWMDSVTQILKVDRINETHRRAIGTVKIFRTFEFEPGV